jgi:GNAT superfamily N-acetyltransferase
MFSPARFAPKSPRHGLRYGAVLAGLSSDAVIEIRMLTEDELPRVEAALPLDRLTNPVAAAGYLIAWEEGSPIGHAYVEWDGTELGLPELQDVFVTPERRGAGVGTALTREAERFVAARGHDRLSLSVGIGNPRARALYERLGYEAADHPPKRIRGTILLQSGPLEVDDTLLYYVKRGLSSAPWQVTWAWGSQTRSPAQMKRSAAGSYLCTHPTGSQRAPGRARRQRRARRRAR